MSSEKTDVLYIGQARPYLVAQLAKTFTIHQAANQDAVNESLLRALAPHLRLVAVAGAPAGINSDLMKKLPKLEIISSFGVGYDNVDFRYAAAHGIIVTNTPDVLNEEVADTALGLLLCTVRELPQAERHLRAGKWPQGDYRLTPSLRNRTVGLVGLGRIGRAIARRLDAMRVPVVYHTRHAQPDVSYRHYPSLIEMAQAVDVLLAIVPGGASTRNMIDARVLEALGPNGILINMARGSVVDEPALIEALRNGTIFSAGLDVFVNEPNVPAELRALENVVLLPHVGSASVATREAMEQLMVDNLNAWNTGKPLLSPVPETPSARG